jgi:hypothetical protein
MTTLDDANNGRSDIASLPGTVIVDELARPAGPRPGQIAQRPCDNKGDALAEVSRRSSLAGPHRQRCGCRGESGLG